MLAEAVFGFYFVCLCFFLGVGFFVLRFAFCVQFGYWCVKFVMQHVLFGGKFFRGYWSGREVIPALYFSG